MEYNSIETKKYLKENFKYVIYLPTMLLDKISESEEICWCIDHFGEMAFEEITKNDGTYYILKNNRWDFWINYGYDGFNFYFKNENDAMLFKLTWS